MNLEEKLKLVATYVRLKVEEENKDTNPDLYGECMDASDEIVSMLSDIGIEAEFIEGWVSYDMGGCCSDRSYDEHCWVEVKDGDDVWYVDVTATQFNRLMCTEFEPIIVTKERPKAMSYDEPVFEDDFDED